MSDKPQSITAQMIALSDLTPNPNNPRATTKDDAGPVVNPSFITKMLEIDVGSNSCVTRQDYNNDGIFDLLVGDSVGQVWLYTNIGTNDDPVFMAPSRVQLDAGDLIVIGGRASPYLIDWNNDLKIDLICGSGNGLVYLFINTSGNDNPVFTVANMFVIQLGIVDLDVGNNSRPCVIDWDNTKQKAVKCA